MHDLCLIAFLCPGHHSRASSHLELLTSRPLRTSPLFLRLRDLRANCLQFMGYERPVYFMGPNDRSGNPVFPLPASPLPPLCLLTIALLLQETASRVGHLPSCGRLAVWARPLCTYACISAALFLISLPGEWNAPSILTTCILTMVI